MYIADALEDHRTFLADGPRRLGERDEGEFEKGLFAKPPRSRNGQNWKGSAAAVHSL
jgi:hypothetical protein